MRLIDAEPLEKRSPKLRTLIKEQPTIDVVNDWILVRDKLPEENGRYLVSYEDSVTILNFFNGKWFFPVNGNGCIAHEETEPNLAWKPLPKPCEKLK